MGPVPPHFRRLLLGALLTALAAFGAADAVGAAAFDDWTAVIVAGDFHAHSGAPSEVFDNARRDLARAFVAAGFNAANVRQFSARPRLARGDAAFKAEPEAIYDQLSALAKQARGGCLVYFTSHGSPDGVLLGDGLLTPAMMATMIDEACGQRPVVAIVSACYSGVFVPALDGPDRMVLTAARPDRTSFGCGESDRHTFFDGCVLKELPQAHDFLALGRTVQACVADQEAALDASPPSEPQLVIGGAFRFEAPLYAFAPPHPSATEATNH